MSAGIVAPSSFLFASLSRSVVLPIPFGPFILRRSPLLSFISTSLWIGSWSFIIPTEVIVTIGFSYGGASIVKSVMVLSSSLTLTILPSASSISSRSFDANLRIFPPLFAKKFTLSFLSWMLFLSCAFFLCSARILALIFSTTSK